MLLFSITPLNSDSELPFIKLGKTQFQAPATQLRLYLPQPLLSCTGPLQACGQCRGRGVGSVAETDRAPRASTRSPGRIHRDFLGPNKLIYV